jgi:hypothetical protein
MLAALASQSSGGRIPELYAPKVVGGSVGHADSLRLNPDAVFADSRRCRLLLGHPQRFSSGRGVIRSHWSDHEQLGSNPLEPKMA